MAPYNACCSHSSQQLSSDEQNQTYSSRIFHLSVYLSPLLPKDEPIQTYPSSSFLLLSIPPDSCPRMNQSRPTHPAASFFCLSLPTPAQEYTNPDLGLPIQQLPSSVYPSPLLPKNTPIQTWVYPSCSFLLLSIPPHSCPKKHQSSSFHDSVSPSHPNLVRRPSLGDEL
ncbi:hypothetical protein RRG08_005233 [Elysia crispata]|uniref:Uncharacterized protein n=1 Tax=Elysia crispata TaxID=231223 RepID=A0AAE1E285_9GAST|nr:hypothetical protein RRG08_005233 [Elysia crispata]